jgi:predicted GIY-YIG superfamily endonuclease
LDKLIVKKEYKQTKRPMGVYGIRNSRNDRVYIGSGTDLLAKINRHKAELKFGSHRNKELQEAPHQTSWLW